MDNFFFPIMKDIYFLLQKKISNFRNSIPFNTSIAIMMTKVPSHQKIMILTGLE